MQVTICDNEGCGNQVAETTKLTYKLVKTYGYVDITLNADADWCEICIEKMTKRLAREAVHELRTPRPKKDNEK